MTYDQSRRELIDVKPMRRSLRRLARSSPYAALWFNYLRWQRWRTRRFILEDMQKQFAKRRG